MYSLNLGRSSLLHKVTDDPMSRSAGIMQFPMAMFTVGLRSPPYLIELSKLQQVRMLWGRALPKILPSSCFPTLIVPTLLDYFRSLDHIDARDRSFRMTNCPVLGTGGSNLTPGRLGGLGSCQSWTGTVLFLSYAALSCNLCLLYTSPSPRD